MKTKQEVHELEVHQIELDAKWRTLSAIEQNSYRKYNALIFLPSGYFISLKKKCDCGKLARFRNVAKERFKLINSRLGFLFGWDKTSFQSFFRETFKDKTKQKCEVVLQCEDTNLCYVLLTGIVAADNKQCNIIMVDITEDWVK
jgi:hypothetical protein